MRKFSFLLFWYFFFFFKQKTAYEMRISDWSSDVCSSDLRICRASCATAELAGRLVGNAAARIFRDSLYSWAEQSRLPVNRGNFSICRVKLAYRSEEHTSELQSLMRISYAVFCLKKKKKTKKRSRPNKYMKYTVLTTSYTQSSNVV